MHITIPLYLIEKDKDIVDLCNNLLREYPRFCGIIVGQFEKNTGNCFGFWDGSGIDWFSDERISYPKTFASIRNADKRSEKLNKESEDDRCIFLSVFWVAPEAEINLKPLEKYMKMVSGQFPGSPHR